MDSIGEILKTAREEKGYSIEQAARETNIAKRYLQAIETEDVSIFPGETYFIGFLRNYADFLGQDAERLIGLYRNMKIQEQPPPMEELLDTKKSRKTPVILSVIILLVLGAAFWFFILPMLEDKDAGRPAEVSSPVTDDSVPAEAAGDGEKYEFKNEILERKFLSGDMIGVFIDGTEYTLVLEKVDDEIILNAEGSSISLSLDISTLLDLSGDGENDVKILPRQIIPEENAVVLYLDKYVESSDPVTREPDEIVSVAENREPPEEEAAGGEPVTRGTEAVIGTAGDASRESRIRVIMEADNPEPFDLDVVFRGLCLLRYVADNNGREERYFHKSEVFKLEADREIRLWISNAGSFKGKIGGVDIPMGNPGEVATKLIRWEKDNDSGQYQLKLIPVY